MPGPCLFCAFLDHTLLDSGVLSPEEGERLHGVLVHLRSCGEVAHRYHRGELTERELEEDYHGETACTDDAPYDLVRGAVVRFCQAHPAPIPYQPRPDIRH